MNENITEELLWIWMTKIGKPVSKAISLVYEKFGDPMNAWENGKMTEEEINATDTPVFYTRVSDEKIREEAKREYENTINAGIRIILKNSPLYPFALLQVYSAPPVLYCIGRLPAEVNSSMPLISVVGSRSCTSYGRNNTYRICRELSQCGVGIVSGMARGIDVSAHSAALDTRGYTAAVLGGGPDVIYPPEHRKIYEQIAETGCIISEHPKGTEPLRNFFPARNRIIAGMSSGTFVTEAGKSSGAMITVDRALEEGRDVFAMPGNIDSGASEGTNMLIKKGAVCVTCAADILEQLNINESVCGEKGIFNEILMTENEKEVYNMILGGAARPEYSESGAAMQPGTVSAVLTKLELKGIIERSPSGSWTVKKFFTT